MSKEVWPDGLHPLVNTVTAWIELFKQHRELLLGGDLIRMPLPDASLYVHGVVAGDRSRGIFGFTTVGRSEVVSPGRLRFAGLDPAALPGSLR